jgi:hypothetical protein
MLVYIDAKARQVVSASFQNQREDGSTFAGNVDVGCVLILAEQREMEQDSQRRRIGSEDNDLRGSSIERLGGYKDTSFVSRDLCNLGNHSEQKCRKPTFVSSLLQLAIVRRLLDKVQDLRCQSFIGNWPCYHIIRSELASLGFRW